MKKSAVIIAASLLLGGCSDSGRLAAKPPQVSAATDERELCADITRLVEDRFKEIDDAYCVMSGSTAIIGLDLVSMPEDGALIALKRGIEEAVLSAYGGQIERVSVTASPELVDRIVNMIGDEKETNRHPSDLDEFYKLTPAI
ncbi:MAG: YhcN/YlaJ family sporulation lipoprotein [Clostridiales bacterium]|jgi:outer membrane murein-binding lipoprotein Lpp|nr:YhcN/YlaJ family sporulation lipoprotein [Clostridiales bacterium]